MLWLIFKIFISTSIIVFSSWLAGKKPGLAGFIFALPISTLLVIPLHYKEWSDAAKSVEFAKSIFYSVPLSLLFFVPFLFAEKFQLNFWTMYSLGIVLLAAGYFIHSRFILA
jgi:hypothetical protein